MPGARRFPLADLAFHGRTKFPATTSSTRLPILSGSDQGQQKPAVKRASKPSDNFPLIFESNSSGDATILKSNLSWTFQMTFAVRSISSVLLTQLIKPSDPAQRNCASSLK